MIFGDGEDDNRDMYPQKIMNEKHDENKPTLRTNLSIIPDTINFNGNRYDRATWCIETKDSVIYNLSILFLKIIDFPSRHWQNTKYCNDSCKPFANTSRCWEWMLFSITNNYFAE